MATKQQLETGADNIIANAEATEDPIKQFCIIYTGTVKPTLELVKNFTGAKVDEQIDKLIYAADGVCAGNNPDVKNYCTIWNTYHLKGILKSIQFFTGPKVDKALNKFIEISDNLCTQI
ncbi:MAG: hypothetical protein Q8T03_02755 [Bacteroidota bacterium]|nr:hypothetical protein [Bacteroidota bacterium]